MTIRRTELPPQCRPVPWRTDASGARGAFGRASLAAARPRAHVMKPLIRRLRQLEPNAGARESGEPSPAEILFERRRRRLETVRLRYEGHPPGPLRYGRGNGLPDAEIPRLARARRWAEAVQTAEQAP